MILRKFREAAVQRLRSERCSLIRHFRLGASDFWGGMSNPTRRRSPQLGDPVPDSHFEASETKYRPIP